MKKILLTASLLPGMIACHNTNSCEKVMCTADFRMITVQLQDSSGNPFVADKIISINNTNQILHTDTGMLLGDGRYYTIADDSHLKLLQQDTSYRSIIMKVIKNNDTLASASYTIAADCCHVSKVAGKDTIVIP